MAVAIATWCNTIPAYLWSL